MNSRGRDKLRINVASGAHHTDTPPTPIYTSVERECFILFKNQFSHPRPPEIWIQSKASIASAYHLHGIALINKSCPGPLPHHTHRFKRASIRQRNEQKKKQQLDARERDNKTAIIVNFIPRPAWRTLLLMLARPLSPITNRMAFNDNAATIVLSSPRIYPRKFQYNQQQRAKRRVACIYIYKPTHIRPNNSVSIIDIALASRKFAYAHTPLPSRRTTRIITMTGRARRERRS